MKHPASLTLTGVAYQTSKKPRLHDTSSMTSYVDSQHSPHALRYRRTTTSAPSCKGLSGQQLLLCNHYVKMKAYYEHQQMSDFLKTVHSYEERYYAYEQLLRQQYQQLNMLLSQQFHCYREAAKNQAINDYFALKNLGLLDIASQSIQQTYVLGELQNPSEMLTVCECYQPNEVYNRTSAQTVYLGAANDTIETLTRNSEINVRASKIEAEPVMLKSQTYRYVESSNIAHSPGAEDAEHFSSELFDHSISNMFEDLLD